MLVNLGLNNILKEVGGLEGQHGREFDSTELLEGRSINDIKPFIFGMNPQYIGLYYFKYIYFSKSTTCCNLADSKAVSINLIIRNTCSFFTIISSLPFST